jgi:hypothetical protein
MGRLLCRNKLCKSNSIGTDIWKKYNLGGLFANMQGDRYSTKVPLLTWHRSKLVKPV